MTQTPDVQIMLGLRAPPVAIAFLDRIPGDLPAWSGPPQPAGCAFWKEAQSGASFYTTAADHFNCAVGAFTHGIDLPAERAEQLGDTISLMVENRYIDPAEVPGIPRLPKAPVAVAYGPGDTPLFSPDVVLLMANPAQAMVIYEAAVRSGAGAAPTNLLGRPSCAVLPATLSAGQATVSLGCAGNRLYTGLRDDELHVAIPGAKWADFRARLTEILGANERMSAYYQDHEASVRTA
jgi:uncharacterized protein (DUF169 family)